MPALLEITGDDIAQLDDADLRTLIGLLCEADYRQAGLPTRGITWGGHQDAADGGLDVVVRDDVPPPKNSFVPRSVTGFQVKKPNMSKSKILGEMRPKDALRESIRSLIQEKGAYIIVSSGASVTDTPMKGRIKAMREAVADEANSDNLAIDYLDRGRIATWVRSHPSLVLWVRNKIGRELKGWYPYANWANPKAGVDEEYLLDDGLRLHDGLKRKDVGMSVQEGINNLREELSAPGTSVRLAGLSGVGKTRLAQAIFDDRVGARALNPDLAFYTDMAFSPDPDPRSLAEQLIARRTRAILIVDNCPPELHKLLTKACSVRESTVSLLTIEYDVRDNVSGETSVYRLEPASEELIENLIRKRFAHISQVDAKTIAEHSGGNARIAIALANTLEKGETLSGIRDENLFERLFQQRHGPDRNLLMSAAVCSLVYSFEGTDAESKKSELKLLASLIGRTGQELYQDVVMIKERELIQSRDVWRAVLPHALANRLAERALETIPKNSIVNAFLQSGSERLIKSFSRRLGYLHDCQQAIEIVDGWLSPDGWLGEANCNFNDLGMDAFRNVAPVSPEKALAMIERTSNGDDGAKFTSREQNHHENFVWLLRHLAYDPALFDRSVEIISRYALSEKSDENDSARKVLKSLFYIYLSGTHAPIEARAKIIRELVDSQDADRQELGISLLDAALESWNFSSSYEFGFGARPRNFGYQPKTYEDIKQWYGTFIDICTGLALSGKPIADRARKVLADKLRGLWLKTGMYDVLENSAIQISKQQPWNEGWIAIKKIIRYDSKHFSKEVLDRIGRLEKILKPDCLFELVRTYVLSSQHVAFGLTGVDDDGDDEAAGWRKAIDASHGLGVQVAQDADTLKSLLPELVTASNGHIGSFSRGLAEGSPNRHTLWEALRAEFESTAPEKRGIGVLQGFLSACADIEPELYNEILDSLIADESLGEFFPIFQATSAIDQRGVERLNQALDTRKAKVGYYKCLAWGGTHEAISDDDLAALLKKILTREEGFGVALEILSMRFHKQKDLAEYSKQLIGVARDVLSTYRFAQERGRHDMQDYELSLIAISCLKGDDGGRSAEVICQNLAQAIIDGHIYPFDYPELFGCLARVQPIIFLDALIGNDKINAYHLRRIFGQDSRHGENPIDQISDDDLITWCETDPAARYPLLCSAMQPFSESAETKKLEWKPVVFRFLDNAPELESVFENISIAMVPQSWSGSRADIMERRSALYKELFQHDNDEVASLAKAKYLDLRKMIEEERKFEQSYNRRQFESFE